jgi:hypothetical protein
LIDYQFFVKKYFPEKGLKPSGISLLLCRNPIRAGLIDSIPNSINQSCQGALALKSS